MNLGYLKKVVGGVTWSKLSNTVQQVHQKSGQNKLWIFCDLIWCALRYGAGHNDYIMFEFYAMNGRQRKTYFTRLINKKFIDNSNKRELAKIFDEKNIFVAEFKEFLKRDVLDMQKASYDDFVAFIADKKAFFIKPNDGEGGRGIKKIYVADYEKPRELFNWLKDPQNDVGLAEEIIQQHPVAAMIHPSSLNCLRIGTYVKDGKPLIVYATFKAGVGGAEVDNLSQGGICCHYDLDKGEICGQGHDEYLQKYDYHPTTHVKLVGYKLPFSEEVKEMVCQAALKYPEFKYVGWDVCFTVNGPAIIEGNNYPGYDFPQLPDDGAERKGLLGRFDDLGIAI